MVKKTKECFVLVLFLLAVNFSCAQSQEEIQTGASQIPAVVSKLKGKRIALMVNQTSVVGRTHLVDTLKSLGIQIKKIFSVEHGFRGDADAGEIVGNAVDPKSGIPIISLYGKSKKPTVQDLKDIDLVIFDIQDIGVRFFTYISSLHYLMEACAENEKKLLVLDRPNPNGLLIDGPVLQPKLKSFVGMHPIPIAHGLTIGEYAQMINGEGFLEGQVSCGLEIIPIKNWKHSDPYSLNIRPSPNLPNDHAIALYPSICLFEGTVLSVGRGTRNPFEFVGHPDLKQYTFNFTPISIPGMAKAPQFENQVCYGLDLRSATIKKQLDLGYLIELYKSFPDKEKFFTNYFNSLAGTPELKNQIIMGLTEEQIRATWKKDLENFRAVRNKYLLYP